jgi:flavin prenyltransferase
VTSRSARATLEVETGLSTREVASLSEIHLDNMLALARMGAAIMPPMPAFSTHPASVDDIVDHIVARVLDQFGLEHVGVRR